MYSRLYITLVVFVGYLTYPHTQLNDTGNGEPVAMIALINITELPYIFFRRAIPVTATSKSTLP
jgi:microcystin degradation protein MlrC